MGVDYDDVTETLELEGVQKFADSFDGAARRRAREARESSPRRERERAELIDRIWERDPTVWTGADEAKWLGWLDEPRRMGERVAELEAFADAVADDGLDAVVLLGMGGSSLAPEVLRRTFRVESFHVLDTTHPAAIRAVEASIDLERTLFVSASKSGGDARDALAHRLLLGADRQARLAFVAITDPGSELERWRASAASATSSRASRRSAAATPRSRRSASSRRR